jgi:hypothetical protein
VFQGPETRPLKNFPFADPSGADRTGLLPAPQSPRLYLDGGTVETSAARTHQAEWRVPVSGRRARGLRRGEQAGPGRAASDALIEVELFRGFVTTMTAAEIRPLIERLRALVSVRPPIEAPAPPAADSFPLLID